MKKGDILEGIVERIDFPNKGVIPIEDRKVIVKNTIPGQKIRFRLQKKNSSKCEGQALEIVERSADEIASDCPHFEICGGCVYRTLPYEKQLELKKGQMLSLLAQTGDEPHFEGILGSPEDLGYRNKMEFSFGDACKGGEMMLGMHKRGSFYDIVTVDHCRIVHEDFRKVLMCVLEIARASGLDYFHKVSHQGYFRHLLVRRAVKTGEILVDLVTSTQAEPAKVKEIEEALVSGLQSLELEGSLAGILHTVNDRVADVIIDEGTTVLAGRDYFYEELLGLQFRITPFSFFQTNSLGAEILYSKAREYVGETKDKVIFDLYSGTGTIAQLLAPVASHVTGVEIVEEAVEAAKENAARNGLNNCTFIAGDVLKVIDELTEKPDLLVLDPPRDGIHPKALPKLIKFGVNRIVYIACKPTSFVRDYASFRYAGYRIEESCAVDMFPGTSGTELAVLLTKEN